MHDFGFSDLRLVNDYAAPVEAARSAVDAQAVLAAAVVTEDVASAVTGCTRVIGTTAVGQRDIRHRLLGLAEAAGEMRGELRREDGGGRVALLFGSEKTGLSNEELSYCDSLLTIPMAEYAELRRPSMNLGQAVAVCLWELARSGASVVAPERAAATADEVERVYRLLYEVLEQSEYTRRHGATADPVQIRRLVYRMGLGREDVAAWLGILRQLAWKMRGPGV